MMNGECRSRTSEKSPKPEIASYRLEFQPQLVEEAVLLAITGHPDELAFRNARNDLYNVDDQDRRDELFEEFHQQWFERLGLDKPLTDILSLWPLLKTGTSKCLLLAARSYKDIGAELYVAPADSQGTPRDRRSIVILITPALLIQSKEFLTFLRPELLHVVDMLDTQFGYQPDLPKSGAGPTYDQFLKNRYQVLWDITIDGRLYRNGWLPGAAKEKQLSRFKQTFQGPEKELERLFIYFFDHTRPNHDELVSFALAPESWFLDARQPEAGRRCSLCRFPSFDLVNAATHLSAALIEEIRKDYPDWAPSSSICRQCADLYELKVSDTPGLAATW